MHVLDTQLKHNDCGVSVVKTICNIFRSPISRRRIEDSLFLDSQGSRLADIKSFFEQHGFTATAQLLDLNRKDADYYNARSPFVLPVHSRSGAHYVVVNGYARGRFDVLDPAQNAPERLSLPELRKRALVSANTMRGLGARDQALVLCGQLLNEYGLDPEAEGKTNPPDMLFNKISYFLYIRDGFGFADRAAEGAFLRDQLRNQDMGRVPAQFQSLHVTGERVTVSAPVILSVSGPPGAAINQTPLAEEGENAFLLLYRALGRYKDKVLLYIAIALASVSFTQLYVFLNQYLLDDILDVKKASVIPAFVLAIAGYYLLDIGLYLWKKWLAIVVAIRLDRLFLTAFDDKLNRYSLAFIQGYKKGDLTERLSDATKLKAFFTKYLVNILVDSAVSLYILGVLLYFDWQLTLLVIAVMALFYLWFRIITPLLQRNEQIRFARKSDFFSLMLEKMEGIQTLKCLGYDRRFSEKIAGDIDGLLDIQARTQKLNVLNSGVAIVITTTAKIALVWFLAYACVVRSSLSLGQVVTFLTLSSRIFSSLGALLDENLTVQENAIILKRYINFQEPGAAAGTWRESLPGPLESLEFEGVSFGYHPAQPLLEELCLRIRRGEKIRVTGRNGSGKSTLSKLIALVYQAQAGRVLVNGEPLREERVAAVREKILLVSNEDALFNDTILYNLTFQNAVWDERVDVLAEQLGIADWIRRMTAQGADYRISESGRNLSTGQRKKLLILRALLHPAEFLIFDEALSGIDADSRAHIERFLNSVTDRTFIFIAHEDIRHIRFDHTFVLAGKRLTDHESDNPC